MANETPSEPVPPIEPTPAVAPPPPPIVPPAPPVAPTDPYAASGAYPPLPPGAPAYVTTQPQYGYAPQPGQPYPGQPYPGQQYPGQPYPGQPYPGQPYYGQPPYNVLAIVGFVLAFFVSLGAVICGHIALSQIKRTGERGHGLALAGVIIGYVGIALGILYLIFFISVFAIAGANGGFSSSGN
jgi:Domain of unknown function (DUF4190)